MSLIQELFDAARANADRLAFIESGIPMTYADLPGVITNFTLQLLKRGVNRTSTVAIHGAGPSASLVLALATAMIGCRFISAARGFPLAFAFGITHYVDGSSSAPSADKTLIRLDGEWAKRAPLSSLPPGMLAATAGLDDAPWQIGLSTGSTGKPKHMLISQSNMLARAKRWDVDLAAERPVFFSLFPTLSTNALTKYLWVLLSGGTIVTDVKATDIQKAGVNVMAGSPIQLAQYFGQLGDQAPEGPPMELVWSLGGRLSQGARTLLFRYFSKIRIEFGCVEASLVSHRTLEPGNAEGDSLGVPVASASAEIVDADDNPQPRSTEGALRIKTSCLVPGYLMDPEATKANFKGGWFYTGDLALIDETGAINVTGRIANTLNIGGAKIKAELVESKIEQKYPDIQAICFEFYPASGQIEVALALAIPDAGAIDEIVDDAKEICFAALFGKMPRPHVYVLDKIPLNINGKPDRLRLSEIAPTLPAR